MSIVRRSIDPAVLAVGTAVALSPLVWWEDLGADVGTVAFLLWQVVPFAIIVIFDALARLSYKVAASTALLIAAISIGAQIDMHRSESVFALVGFLYVPILLTCLVALALSVTDALRGITRGAARRDHSG